MPTIILAVTQDVIDQITAGSDFQRQIAVRNASPDIRALLNQANRTNRIPIAICGAFNLFAGDTDAFWNAHQPPGIHAEDFADLFALLARRAGTSVTFSW